MAIVKLVAINPKYRNVPFFMTPVYDPVAREFKTGQTKLTEKELAKEPIIIDPEQQYAVMHMQAFDTNNRKDQLLLEMARTQDLIAPSINKVISGKHLFYIEDQESEATEKIKSSDLMYEAMSKVREDMSAQKLKDLAIFLGIDPDRNPISVIQERIYQRCATEPKEVLSFFTKETKNRMFVLKLVHYGILRKNVDRIVDGELLVGRNTEEAVLFVQDPKNEMLTGKWGAALDKREGRALPEGKKGSNNRADVSDSSQIGNSGSGVKEE